MILSFNIPTYNRCNYLAITLDKIACQIEKLQLENDVEINLSDNHSSDDTKKVWDNCVHKHPTLVFHYKRNDANLGPDANFISAMKMATGEYSLLWGDDDYLKENGLERIIQLIEFGKNNDIQLLISSTSVINNDGILIYEKKFLRNDINDIVVDFSDINQIRSYFFLLRDMGGLLSFITDVIYRTDIIDKVPYYSKFSGTHYAFLSYWWGWLAQGNKLYCSNISFVNATEQYQSAYGYGVNREMVDYHGYKVITETVLKDTAYVEDFKNAFLNLHSILYNRLLAISEKNDFYTTLLPAIRDFGYSEREIDNLICTTKSKYLIKEFIYSLIPDRLLGWMKKNKKR